MVIQEEIQGKRALVKRLLAEEKLGGIYLKRSANFAWLTGGRYNLVGLATETGVAGLLITGDRDYVICSNIEAPRMEKEELLPEQGYEIRSFPWFEDKEASLVAELSGGKAGSDCALSGTVDISGKINPLRWSLTPWEVERFRELGRLTALAAEETVEEIRPGDTECAVVGRLAKRLWERGMDYILPFVAADERISLFRHPVATTRKIQKRAMLSVNARKRGLIVSITRFVQFGKVPDSLAKLYRDTVEIDCAFMAATAVGRPVVEAFEAGLAAYAQRGYRDEYKLHHQGGAIGYIGRDYKVSHSTKEIVRENQGFTWNPSITGSKSEDTMIATSAGPVIVSEPVVHPVLVVESGGYTFRRPDILEL
ncbi:MAG: M24 family metallopeptidase [Spirochaetales bacterium]|jgi:Xaa-Pro aminopeptidase|nr:M24 family metallopeptidase [Spirochaetales bacterium]